MILSIIVTVFLIFAIAPRYGNKNVLVYILICSILGGFTVTSCKGLSLGLHELFSSTKHQSASFFYTYMFALIVIICIIIQMNYLNKALDIFNTAIVTTIYYVLFTLCVMIASSILFKELANISFIDFVGCIAGFLTIVCALCLIHFFKSSDDANNSNINGFIGLSALNETNNRNVEAHIEMNENENKHEHVVQSHVNSKYLIDNQLFKRFLNTFNSNASGFLTPASVNSANLVSSSGANSGGGASNSSYTLLPTINDDDEEDSVYDYSKQKQNS